MATSTDSMTFSGPSQKGGGSSFTPKSSSGSWMDFLPLITDVAGNLLGGYMKGQQSKKTQSAADASVQQQLDLYRQMYGDQRALAMPNYYTGGNAMNLLAKQFGLPAQNYMAASQGQGGQFGGAGGAGQGYGGFVPSAENNWGAGQSVQGHSGGGGPNATAQAVGSAIGTFLPIPIPGVGSAIGAAIGGMFRNGGDNWKTLATGAPQGFDYAAYMQAPDLQAEWAKKDVQSLFGGNKDAYAYWHYNQFGKNEGRQLNPVEQAAGGNAVNDPGSMTSGGQIGQPAGQPGAQKEQSALEGFYSSPYGQLAQQGFLGVDNPQIQGAFSRGGKALSGAATQALYDRGVSRSQNAYGNYIAGLQSLSGIQAPALNALTNAGNTFQSGASNAYGALGQNKINALNSGYSNMADTLGGITNSVTKFGKANWGW